MLATKHNLIIDRKLVEMAYRLKIDPRIIEQYPGYSALIIYATDLVNRPSDESSQKLLRAAEDLQRTTFGEEKATSHPHIAAWREAYKNFGVKPSKYPCSVEALLSRVLKGSDLPGINGIVDLYNALSIRYVLPVGGEDWDRLTSDLTLTFANGTEPFGTYQDGSEIITYPQAGEVVWADSSDATCRMWNWRQCLRTQLTTETRNAYFVLDRLEPYSLDELIKAGEELMMQLKTFSPGCAVNYELLGQK